MNGSVGDDVVDLTFPDESNICYSFPSIDVAYDYASVIRGKKAMNIRLNFNHNSEKCFAFGPGTNYVPAGYVSTADGDWFTVSEE